MGTQPEIINATALNTQYTAFKHFVFEQRYEYEEQQKDKLHRVRSEKSNSEKRLRTLGQLLSERKRIREMKGIKRLEKKEKDLEKRSRFTFEIMHKLWHRNEEVVSKHPDITKMLYLAALIPPSTAEVERSFSLMKLICTRLRISLSQNSLKNCMRICKFRKLTKKDFRDILKDWLKADDTKSKKRKVSSRLRKWLYLHDYYATDLTYLT